MNAIKKLNQSSILTLVFIGLVVIAYFGCNHLAKRFSALPVSGLPKTSPVKKVIDIKTLYPVLVEFTKRAESAEKPEQPLDAAFTDPEPVVKKPESPPIDYVSEVRKRIDLEAIAVDGAFISGHYYLVGEVIASAALNGAVRVNPVLLAVDRYNITVGVMKRKFAIRLEQ